MGTIMTRMRDACVHTNRMCLLRVQEMQAHHARALADAYTLYKHDDAHFYFLHPQLVLSPHQIDATVPLCSKCMLSIGSQSWPRLNVKHVDFGQQAPFGILAQAEQQVVSRTIRFQLAVKIAGRTVRHALIGDGLRCGKP